MMAPLGPLCMMAPLGPLCMMAPLGPLCMMAPLGPQCMMAPLGTVRLMILRWPRAPGPQLTLTLNWPPPLRIPNSGRWSWPKARATAYRCAIMS